MLSLKDGRMIGIIKEGKHHNKIIYLKESNKRGKQVGGKKSIKLDDKDEGQIIPLPNTDEREVVYIAGPSGSGKSTYASEYIQNFTTVFPDSNIFVFSRTDISDDPCFEDVEVDQVIVDDSLLEDPIDITEDIPEYSLVLFDDVNTIQDNKLKKVVDDIMADIMEVGRKLKIWIVITNHLVIPNEKKIARTILNECQSLTVFPKSGSVQQIRYVLKTYFGYTNKQISDYLNTDSRWITFKKTYPQLIFTQYEVIIPS